MAFPSLHEESELLQAVSDKLVKYFSDTRSDGAKVLKEIKSPDELKKIFTDAGVSLSLSEGLPHDNNAITKATDLTLEHSVAVNAPSFLSHLYARSEAPGLCGQFISSSVGATTHTFEISPVFTMMERACISKIISIANFPESSDGMFLPGGSLGNMYAIHLARWKKYGSRIKEEGLYGLKPLCMFVSAHAHYSHLKGMSFLGLGTNNLIKVAVDHRGCMIPEELSKAIQKAKDDGKEPFLVTCTSGTTVFGGYDDFEAVRKIADDNNMWMHIDGCWGAIALMSTKPEMKRLMKGFDSADSFTWNPHKFQAIPHLNSMFITRHENILRECNAATDNYQKSYQNKEYDFADKLILRWHSDACKLWFSWKSIGDAGWTARVDKGIDLTRQLVAYAKNGDFQGRFQVVMEPRFTQFCFWYLPPNFKRLQPYLNQFEHESELWSVVHEIAPAIRTRMQHDGLEWVSVHSMAIDGKDPLPNFFRIVVTSSAILTKEMLQNVLHNIDNVGCQLAEEHFQKWCKENELDLGFPEMVLKFGFQKWCKENELDLGFLKRKASSSSSADTASTPPKKQNTSD